MMRETDVLIVGGGVAGLTASAELALDGVRSITIEEEEVLGGRVSMISHVFPTMVEGEELCRDLMMKIDHKMTEVMTSSSIVGISRDGPFFNSSIDLKGKIVTVRSKAVVLAMGLEPIDASIIPEFGFGKHSNVITSLDLERMLSAGGLRRPSDGAVPKTVTFVQCVGSRVERRGVRYCSNVCCLNAVKNSSLIKDMYPDTSCFILYIDIRTHGKGYEDAYKEARRKGVVFIRGQPSLVIQKDGRLLVCGENTLLKELYEIDAELVVLSVGLRTSERNQMLLSSCEVGTDRDGLPLALNELASTSSSKSDGIFFAGSMEAPKDIRDTITHAKACASAVRRYLEK